jgi:hypothetical protein
VTPLYTAYDEDLNFYWRSPSSTHHSQYLKENNKIGFVVFDSNASEGTGEGVYGQGTADELLGKEDVERALSYTYDRGGDTTEPTEMFMDERRR